MPKTLKVMPITENRNFRRIAPKADMRQISKTISSSEEPETLEILSDDDEVIEVTSKKKYQVCSNDKNKIVIKSTKSMEPTLALDCWVEDLSPVQAALQRELEKEYTEMTNKVETYLDKTNSVVIFEGEHISAYECDEPLSSVPQKQQPKPITKSNGPTTSTAQNTYSYVLDPRSGQVVGTLTPGQIVANASTTSSNSNSQVVNRQTRKRTRGNSPPATPAQPIKLQKLSQPPPLVTIRQPDSSKTTSSTTTTTAKAPAVVDLTSDENKAADTKEIAFNKLQGKTFPSLVVVARPHLKVPPANASYERTKLDLKVKSVLMHAPTKFTEWLIQQGLIRAEQVCPQHSRNKLKLGMYSDASKFPFSGGYVWISECCPQRFVSVFSGSMFEGSPHPPSVLLKLVYHWACQTNVQNVIQWVKVENLYVKGLNTWLRAVCTVALHTHVPQLGGPGVRVEIGVISLGTTSQDGNQRQVKVEVLGILETFTKRIRLRAVEPLTDQDRSLKKRFVKILEPLSPWVHPESIIVTDMTVDKSTLQAMGFKNVQQDSTINKGNNQIMDYLRRIVPRMFQNTLSLLSRQIIQQFLDELVWREWFGTTPAHTFDNLLIHLAEQTRTDCGQSLVVRLNKVATNPFKNWGIQTNVNVNKYTIETPKRQRRKQQINKTYHTGSDLLKPARSTSPDFPEQTVPLEHYYYGTIEATNDTEIVPLNIKCHVCKELFTSNIELMKHYFNHAHNITSTYQCKYCLAGVTTKEGLETHVLTTHPSTTKIGNEFVCIICESKFNSTYLLGKHMSIEHVPSELPYQCGTCNFRSSSHKETIDHFYVAHLDQGVLQCPFCLKSTVLATPGKITAQHLYYFLQHLQKHQKKGVAKKCNKCSLWFVQQNGAKDHMKMHETQRRKAGLKPWVVPRNCIMVPKSLNEDQDEETDISNLVISVPENMNCKECNTDLKLKDHFPGVISCENETCDFITCCKNSMEKHSEECKTFGVNLPELPLPFEMFCVCGHSNKDGNAMAKHLAVCERHSAYPSAEAAKAATVTHSMLDVLGLVRRPEEPVSSSEAVLSDEDKGSKIKSDENDASSENGKQKLKRTKRTMIKGYKKPKRVVETNDLNEEASKEVVEGKEDAGVSGSSGAELRQEDVDKDKENESSKGNTNSLKGGNSSESVELMDVDNDSNVCKTSEESGNSNVNLSDKTINKKCKKSGALGENETVNTDIMEEVGEESRLSENNSQENSNDLVQDGVENSNEVNENGSLNEESQNDLDLTDVSFTEKDLQDIQTSTDKDGVNLEDILSNAEDKMLHEQSEDVDGLLNDIIESECAKSNDISDVMMMN